LFVFVSEKKEREGSFEIDSRNEKRRVKEPNLFKRKQVLWMARSGCEIFQEILELIPNYEGNQVERSKRIQINKS